MRSDDEWGGSGDGEYPGWPEQSSPEQTGNGVLSRSPDHQQRSKWPSHSPEQQRFDSKWGPGGACIRTIVLDLEAALQDCNERLFAKTQELQAEQAENERLRAQTVRLAEENDRVDELEACQRAVEAEQALDRRTRTQHGLLQAQAAKDGREKKNKNVEELLQQANKDSAQRIAKAQAAREAAEMKVKTVEQRLATIWRLTHGVRGSTKTMKKLQSYKRS